MSSQTTELKPGESIRIGDAVVTLVEKRGQRARITIEAPPEVKISRGNDKKQAQECHISHNVRGDTHVRNPHPVR